MNKQYFRLLKLSFIGAFAGIIYYILSILFSYYTKNTQLIVDMTVGGIIFMMVGWGIILSIMLFQPQLKGNKKLFAGGGIGGFIAGIFFPWGIGIYVALIVFPVILAATIRLAGVKKVWLKVMVGGIFGGIAGIVISTALASAILILQQSVPGLKSEVFNVAYSASIIGIIVYFCNLGILIGIKQG